MHDPKTALALAVRGQHGRLRTLWRLHARCRRCFAFNIPGGTRSRRCHCLWGGRGGGELGVGEQVGRLARAHCVDGRGVGLERTVGRRVAEGEGGARECTCDTCMPLSSKVMGERGTVSCASLSVKKRPITKEKHSTPTNLEAATLHAHRLGAFPPNVPLLTPEGGGRPHQCRCRSAFQRTDRDRGLCGAGAILLRMYLHQMSTATRHRQHVAHLQQHRPSREDSERPRSSVPDYIFNFLRAKKDSAVVPALAPHCF